MGHSASGLNQVFHKSRLINFQVQRNDVLFTSFHLIPFASNSLSTAFVSFFKLTSTSSILSILVMRTLPTGLSMKIYPGLPTLAMKIPLFRVYWIGLFDPAIETLLMGHNKCSRPSTAPSTSACSHATQLPQTKNALFHGPPLFQVPRLVAIKIPLLREYRIGPRPGHVNTGSRFCALSLDKSHLFPLGFVSVELASDWAPSRQRLSSQFSPEKECDVLGSANLFYFVISCTGRFSPPHVDTARQYTI